MKSSEDGTGHYGVVQWTCVFFVSSAGPVPAMMLAAWAPVTPTVGIVPAKRMLKAAYVTGGCAHLQSGLGGLW